jgi:hypothetical protein
MDDDLYVIGEVARRTGLPVRTIRFYADEGIVPPTQHRERVARPYHPCASVRLVHHSFEGTPTPIGSTHGPDGRVTNPPERNMTSISSHVDGSAVAATERS